jgi:hypothetical protein
VTLRAVVLDADAFLALRSLALLSPIAEGLAEHTRLVVTGYVRGRELTTVEPELAALESAGLVHHERLLRGSPAQVTFTRFKRAILQHDKAMKRVDLGEAECVAWALAQDPTAAIVSCDEGARQFAARQRVQATDVFGLGVAAVRLGALDVAVLRERVAPWDSPDQFVCRPSGYTSFDECFAARLRDESDLLQP